MFTATDRQIYEWHDGDKKRVADPIKCHLAMMDGKLDWEVEIEKITSEDFSTLRPVIDKAREMFGAEELSVDENGGIHGLTDLQVVHLLQDFAGYLSSLKKTTENSAPSLVCSEGSDH